jgi:acetyl esterase/lipase
VEEIFLKLKKEWEAEMAASPGIPLWPAGGTPGFKQEFGQPEPSIVPFLLDKRAKPRGAVIVCPGGGYEFKAPHEGRPIARMLNASGFHAFVLDYRVIPYTIENPIMDIKRAIRTVRARSAEWRVNPEKIAVLGFSAGGHLSIMASTHFDPGDPSSPDPVERVSCRPDAQIPCYPAVSYKMFSAQRDSKGKMTGLFGSGYAMADMEAASGELCVREDTPPAFIWGTWDDYLYEQWPPYLKALRSKKVEATFHLFPCGGHGMGLARGNPLASQWPALCAAWLKELGF